MKKVLISILMLIFIISISISVNAATTGNITVSLSKDTVKAGDEFSIIVTATDTNNINTVEYTTVDIKDQNGQTSESVVVKSVEPVSSNWYKESEGQSNYFVYSGEKTQNQEVFKVTFTVEDDAIAGTYTIDVNGLKVYSLNLEDDTTDIGTKSVSLKVIEDDTTAGEQEDDSSNDGADDGYDADDNTDSDNDTKEENKDKNVNKDKNTNKDKTKLPQTGAENTTIIAIITLGIISVISYVSYKKYNNI